jgi:hypothetical protein
MSKINKRLDTLEAELQPQGFKVFWRSTTDPDIYTDNEGVEYSIDEIRALPLKDVILVERVKKAVNNTLYDKTKGGEK